MKQFLLKKDLPTIRAGRVIKLSDDGKFGSPILMNVEKNTSVLYMFPIDILINDKDWFEEFEFDGIGMPKIDEKYDWLLRFKIGKGKDFYERYYNFEDAKKRADEFIEYKDRVVSISQYNEETDKGLIILSKEQNNKILNIK